jgi:hypothetical protein
MLIPVPGTSLFLYGVATTDAKLASPAARQDHFVWLCEYLIPGHERFHVGTDLWHQPVEI